MTVVVFILSLPFPPVDMIMLIGIVIVFIYPSLLFLEQDTLYLMLKQDYVYDGREETFYTF